MDKLKVYDPKSIKEIEFKTINTLKITMDDLIFIAAKNLFETIINHQLVHKNNKILILVGRGNNGSDALFLGVHLLQNQYDVSFFILNHTLSKHQFDLLKTVYSDQLKIIDQVGIDCSYDLIIDGIYGIGLNQKIAEQELKIIQKINQLNQNVISIDIPSGIHPDSGIKMGDAIIAKYTLICHSYKRGNLLGDAKDHHGKIILVDMGLVENDVHHEFLIHLDSSEIILPKRLENTHKYHYGSLLVIGGSKHMFGAPILSLHAALKSGAGLATWALDQSLKTYKTNQWPDIIKAYIKDEDELIELAKNKKAIIFGMGLGHQESICSNAIKKLIDLKIPMLIDADGLKLFQNVEHLVDQKHLVLTPHMMEFSRLIEKDIIKLNEHPIMYLKSYPFLGYLILKGPCTLLKHQDDIYYLNIGHSGMAKAGFGDVLSGIIGTMMMKYPLIDAIIKGLFIFHYASIITKEIEKEHSMTASNLVDHIKDVLHKGD